MSDYPERLRVRLARALENFNPQGASNTIDEAFASLSIDAALSEVVLPRALAKNKALGSVWTASTIAHAGLLEICSLELARGWDNGGNPTVVIASTTDDRYTFGGIAFGLALRDRGWRVVYLGSSGRPESAVGAAERAMRWLWCWRRPIRRGSSCSAILWGGLTPAGICCSSETAPP